MSISGMKVLLYSVGHLERYMSQAFAHNLRTKLTYYTNLSTEQLKAKAAVEAF